MAKEEFEKNYSKCFKILNTFPSLFSNKMYVIRAGIHQMIIRIANRECPDLRLCCLSSAFWLPTSVRKFRTSTMMYAARRLVTIVHKKSKTISVGAQMLFISF